MIKKLLVCFLLLAAAAFGQNKIDLTNMVASQLPVANGGTGAATAAGALLHLFPSGSEVGDLLYCSAYASGACTAWSILPGNTSGTAWLQETMYGVPSWTVPSGGGGGGMVYPGAGIPKSNGSAWQASYTPSGSASALASADSDLAGASSATPACADGSGNLTTVGCSSGGSTNYVTRTILNSTEGTVVNTPARIPYDDVCCGHGKVAQVLAGPGLSNDVFVGITISGAGTSGSSVNVVNGQASCIFDNATTIGDYVGLSSSAPPACHDAGAPDNTQDANDSFFFGYVLATGAAGLEPMYVVPMSASFQPVEASMVYPLLFGKNHSPFFEGTPALAWDASPNARRLAVTQGFPLGFYNGFDASSLVGQIQIYNTSPKTLGLSGGSLHTQWTFPGAVNYTFGNTTVSGDTNLDFGMGARLAWAMTGDTELDSYTNEYDENGSGPVFPFSLCQDGTGGHVLTVNSSNFSGVAVPPAAAYACVTQLFGNLNRWGGSGKFMPIAPATPIHPPALTGQTQALSAVTLAMPGYSVLMRFSGTVACDSAISTATVALNLIWTDISGTVQTITVTATCTALGAASVADMVHAIRVKGGTSLQYSTSVANSPVYDVDVSLETIQ